MGGRSVQRHCHGWPGIAESFGSGQSVTHTAQPAALRFDPGAAEAKVKKASRQSPAIILIGWLTKPSVQNFKQQMTIPFLKSTRS
jgi:hypothetical protein